jgi:predicted CXXCH cytochrome family protein
MLDHYLVAEMPKEAGFKGSKDGGQLYRIAKLHKHEDGKYDVEAVRDDFDFNKNGMKDRDDMAAASYTCSQCHSPGLTPTGTMKHLNNTVGCESCHGPGSIHVAAEGKAGNMVKNNDACKTCHEDGRPTKDPKGNISAQTHYGTRGWFASTHSTNDKTKYCTSCHTVHVTNAKGNLLKGETPEQLCATCHNYKFNVEEVMWRNKTDLRDHFTRDHSFGAFSDEDLGDDPKTPTLEIKNPTAIEKMKKLLGGQI